MLVLTRKKDETIWIGEDVKITIVGLGNGRVRIGIDAPAQRVILRGEVANDAQSDQAA